MADAVEYAEILNTAARQAGYPEEFENPLLLQVKQQIGGMRVFVSLPLN